MALRNLLAALVFAAIDYTTGMPLWWTIGDAVGCGGLGAVLLWCSLSGSVASEDAPELANEKY